MLVLIIIIVTSICKKNHVHVNMQLDYDGFFIRYYEALYYYVIDVITRTVIVSVDV